MESKIYRDDIHVASQWFTEVDKHSGNGVNLGELIEWLAEKEEQAIIYLRPTEDEPARVTIYDASVE